MQELPRKKPCFWTSQERNQVLHHRSSYKYHQIESHFTSKISWKINFFGLKVQVVLVHDVQLHQCHCSHVKQEVKFGHKLSKTIWHHIHLVRTYLFQIFPSKKNSSWNYLGNSFLSSSNPYFYVQHYNIYYVYVYICIYVILYMSVCMFLYIYIFITIFLWISFVLFYKRSCRRFNSYRTRYQVI